MITKNQYEAFKEKTVSALGEAGIALTDDERKNVEIADFGLGRLEEIGLQIVTYVNTERCCAKELVLMPWQICPEHRHPEIHGAKGKEETFRCRRGSVYLYVGGYGDSLENHTIKGHVSEDLKEYFTVFHEICLKPGEQYTLPEDTLHWFQAGEEGCIVSEFSTKSVDEADVFTDARIRRLPEIDN